MDVEVDRPRMVRRLGEHAFEPLLDVGRAALRLLALRLLPIVPGLRVHPRLCRQDGELQVVRILVRQRGHGLGEGHVQRRPLGGGVVGIAAGHGFDQPLLLFGRRRGQRLRLLQRRHGRRVRLGRHRHVDVGAEHQRLAEEAERTARVEALRLAERPARLGVIEIGSLPQALVEIALGLAALGADLVAQRAEIVPELRLRLLIGLHDLGRHGLGLDIGNPAVRPRKPRLNLELRRLSLVGSEMRAGSADAEGDGDRGGKRDGPHETTNSHAKSPPISKLGQVFPPGPKGKTCTGTHLDLADSNGPW